MDEFTNDDGSLNLRERRRRATAAEISEAALALFEQKGMAATTVHEIAQAAGVSDRTCFRYLSSKEEAVLTISAEFDAPLTAWQSRIDPDRPILAQLEEVYADVLAEFDGPLASIAQQHLRVRRLMEAEPQLRASAVSIDAANAWTTAQRIAEASDGRVSESEARLITDYAGVALREAFSEWAESMDAGSPVTLTETYRTKRQQLRDIATTSAL
jgi:AcrR family transcriptional regulator